MNCNFRITHFIATASALVLAQSMLVSAANAHDTGKKHLHFQKPGESTQVSSPTAKQAFRAPNASQQKQKKKVSKQARKVTPVNFEEVVQPTQKKNVKRKTAAQVERTAKRIPAPKQSTAKKSNARRDLQIGPVSHGEVIYESGPVSQGEVVYESGPVFEPAMHSQGCACDVQGGICEPGCGICEPACGCAEPGCGICEPTCGIVDGCGSGVNCGSCVGRPGPDYWCFPVCLPRFKDLSVWAGVHGFRGPRDFTNINGGLESNSNFGFQQGINISGRTPIVGLMFPQLSYQLGYQAVQSQLSGTVNSTDDRTQSFVTAGLFRRVNTGLQFGVVWDYMRDHVEIKSEYQQIRSEISIKSPKGREFGFFNTSNTNSRTYGAITFQTTDQYALFFRKHYGNGYVCRFWGGATGDSKGIFGGDFYAPFNNRWALVSGFNYIIPESDSGLNGVREEGWNVGINLVWHLGRTAKRGCRSPHRPLFPVADNGWMVLTNKNALPAP